MKITIKFFAGLRNHLPTDNGVYTGDFNGNPTVGDILDHFAVPPDIPRIILVNGVHSDREKILMEGETLSVFPPVAGG